MKSIEATGIRAGEKEGYRAARLALAKGEVRLERDAQGHWRLGGVALAPRGTKAAMPPIRLGRMQVADVRVHVHDAGVAPPIIGLLRLTTGVP